MVTGEAIGKWQMAISKTLTAGVRPFVPLINLENSGTLFTADRIGFIHQNGTQHQVQRCYKAYNIGEKPASSF